MGVFSLLPFFHGQRHTEMKLQLCVCQDGSYMAFAPAYRLRLDILYKIITIHIHLHMLTFYSEESHLLISSLISS